MLLFFVSWSSRAMAAASQIARGIGVFLLRRLLPVHRPDGAESSRVLSLGSPLCRGEGSRCMLLVFLAAALCVFGAVPAFARFDMIFGVAIVSCGALSGLVSALPVAPVQASVPDTINIDFDVPAVSLRETTSSLERSFAVHGRPAIAAPSSASFLAAGVAASPEVNVHVPVPSVSSRQASLWLHDARAQVAVLKGLLRRQDAADERVKVAAAAMTGVALLEVHSTVSAPAGDLAKAVLGVAESSASGGAVLGALVPPNPLAGKVADAAAAIQNGRAQGNCLLAKRISVRLVQMVGRSLGLLAWLRQCTLAHVSAVVNLQVGMLLARRRLRIRVMPRGHARVAATHAPRVTILEAVPRVGRKAVSVFVRLPVRALAALHSISQTCPSVRSSIWPKLVVSHGLVCRRLAFRRVADAGQCSRLSSHDLVAACEFRIEFDGVCAHTAALRCDRCILVSQAFLQSVQFAASSWLPLVRFMCSPPRLAKVC